MSSNLAADNSAVEIGPAWGSVGACPLMSFAAPAASVGSSMTVQGTITRRYSGLATLIAKCDPAVPGRFDRSHDFGTWP